MRLAAAVIAHETNTFSPLPTRLHDFGPAGPLYGEEAYRALVGRGRSMAGLIAAAEQAGADVEMIVFGTARPASAVDEEAFEAMTAALCEALASNRFDGLLLEMHGAMVTSHLDDGEGEILRRIRRVAPDLPVAVALDFHGNLSAVTVDSATTLVGYKTFPHLDIVETGRKAGDLLMYALQGNIRPTLAYRHCGVLPNMLRPSDRGGSDGRDHGHGSCRGRGRRPRRECLRRVFAG